MEEVLSSLSKKRDVSVDVYNKVIVVNRRHETTDLGNGSWGKIDYLIKVHRFIQYFKD